MAIPVLFRTSVFQLTILYVVLFGVSVAALGVFIYWRTVGYLENQTREVIRAEVDSLRVEYERGRLLNAIRERSFPSRPQGEGASSYLEGERSVLLLVDNNLRPLEGNLGAWPHTETTNGGWTEFEVQDEEGRSVPVLALTGTLEANFRLLVGREIREIEQLKQNFWRASVLGIGLTMTLALAGGLALAYSAQRRVAQLSRTTRQIIAGDLSQRVPVSRTHDEHAELAESVNAMLDQIESLLAGMRHVGDSIAHDLRGPLTRLRSRLEMLAAEESPTHESVEECLAQADGVLSTFNALLRISRIETGAYRRAFATIDLSPIVSDVVELYEAAAEENLIELRCRVADNAWVFGDRELLAQALTNLVDNAIKYTPIGGHVDIELKKNKDRIVVVVADSGPGVPAEARQRVLQRFARLDEARSKPGNGLGLALVRAVSDQHDGELKLTDNGPGLRVTLSLPAAPDDKRAPGRGTRVEEPADAVPA